MHEASITSSIIESVLDTLRAEHISGRVTEVQVTVGVCQGLAPESMQMFFDIEKPGTTLEQAELKITVQEMVARCPACDQAYPLEMPVLYCPVCGTVMNLLKGNEIVITGIEVEDENPPE